VTFRTRTFISHNPIILSSIPKNNLSRSVAVLWDVILISDHQLLSRLLFRMLRILDEKCSRWEAVKKIQREVGRRRNNLQVHPPLLSITSPSPLSNLLHIFPSSSFSQVSGTQSSSLSVISSGKMNVGKRVRKWVLVERELCWPPEMDSRKFCHLAFLLLLPLWFDWVDWDGGLTSMTVALIPHPLSSPSTHPTFPVSAVTPLPKTHPHSSPQVSPVLFKELT
jgi:hypothetical protein